MINHDTIERKVGLLGVLVAITVSIGGLAEIIPLMMDPQATEAVRPFSVRLRILSYSGGTKPSIGQASIPRTEAEVLERTRERLRPWYDKLGLGDPPQTLPELGRSSPANRPSKVDLPAPDAPMMAIRSP